MNHEKYAYHPNIDDLNIYGLNQAMRSAADWSRKGTAKLFRCCSNELLGPWFKAW
jgi:hypothetical protein